jgi:dolichol-phosphate mannosyltransferase
VIDELRKFGEKPGYWRGLISYIGFRQVAVQFDREARLDGAGNYNRLTGSISGGLNGVIGFSSKPLQMMSVAGAILAGFSFALGLWFLVAKLAGMGLPEGLSTTAILITFFAGTQMLGMGLLGEYVGRIYDEVKQRPPYIIDQKVNFDD